MRCPSCGFQNPVEMNFCLECATPLKNSCPKCGFENPPGAKFCGKCATALIVKQKGKRAKGQKAKVKRCRKQRSVFVRPVSYTHLTLPTTPYV